MAHIHYLHGDSFGNSSKPEIRDMDAHVDPHGVTCSFKLHNKPVSPFWEWTKVPEVDVTARAFLPSTSFISFTLGRGNAYTLRTFEIIRKQNAHPFVLPSVVIGFLIIIIIITTIATILSRRRPRPPSSNSQLPFVVPFAQASPSSPLSTRYQFRQTKPSTDSLWSETLHGIRLGPSTPPHGMSGPEMPC